MNHDEASFKERFNVSRETMGRLAIYSQLLKQWNRRINLVAKGTLEEIWSRHFADSAQILNHAPLAAQNWVDFGSGGGFPGAVIAILAKDATPETKFTLVEADQRKCAFLRTVSRETGATFQVIASRIESLEPLHADVLSARALAPLNDLLGFAKVHLAPDGVALFLKGARAPSELEVARKKWSFNVESVPSVTDPEAVILKIREIERV